MLIDEIMDELDDIMGLSYGFTGLDDWTLLYLYSVCWVALFSLDYCIIGAFWSSKPQFLKYFHERNCNISLSLWTFSYISICMERKFCAVCGDKK